MQTCAMHMYFIWHPVFKEWKLDRNSQRNFDVVVWSVTSSTLTPTPPINNWRRDQYATFKIRIGYIGTFSFEEQKCFETCWKQNEEEKLQQKKLQMKIFDLVIYRLTVCIFVIFWQSIDKMINRWIKKNIKINTFKQ